MKRGLITAATLALLWSGQAVSEEKCAAEGEPVQWIADYCMLKTETDDEIAVSGCIEEERKKSFPSACAGNRQVIIVGKDGLIDSVHVGYDEKGLDFVVESINRAIGPVP